MLLPLVIVNVISLAVIVLCLLPAAGGEAAGIFLCADSSGLRLWRGHDARFYGDDLRLRGAGVRAVVQYFLCCDDVLCLPDAG